VICWPCDNYRIALASRRVGTLVSNCDTAMRPTSLTHSHHHYPLHPLLLLSKTSPLQVRLTDELRCVAQVYKLIAYLRQQEHGENY
jgi:hypothetical protein